ncbi:MAG: ParB/RepB/Spo0J family partition protein [Clostridia bacterium]
MVTRKGLGKGLKALIPDNRENQQKQQVKIAVQPSQQAVVTEAVHQLEINKIKPNPYQPREDFTEESLRELAASIKEYGVLQPIIVQVTDNHYTLIAGERRLRAAKAAGLKKVPAIFRSSSKREMAAIAILENIQREDLTPYEEAKSYATYLEEFQATQEELAIQLGKSRAYVTNLVRLLKLPGKAGELFAKNMLSVGLGKVVLSGAIEQQEAIAEKIVAASLTVRQAEAYIKSLSAKSRQKPLTKMNTQISSGEIKQLEESLREHFSTKVSLETKDEQGRIVIEYYSREDLMRISDILLALGEEQC